jgi:hypothetical protein
MIRIPRILILAATVFLFASCGDDDLTNGPPDEGDPERFEGLWNGGYSMNAAPAGLMDAGSRLAGAATGQALLDLTVEGNTATGEIVLHDLTTLNTFPVLVAGEVEGSSVQLEALTEAPTAWMFSLSVTDDGELTGTVTSPSLDSGSIDFQAVPVGQLTSEPFLTLPATGVISMCHDGEHLWLSTSGIHFIAVDSTGTPADSMQIFYSPGTYWTTSSFAFGHDRFWGTFPSRVLPDPTVSRIFPFNEGGILWDGTFHLPHIADGLAHDGDNLWSLSGEPPKLFQVTESGSVLDSLALPLLSATHLEWDGSRSTFLTLGWYLNWLYEFDENGGIVAAYRAPAQDLFWFPAGLAVDGDVIYYARGYPLAGTEIFRLRRTTP